MSSMPSLNRTCVDSVGHPDRARRSTRRRGAVTIEAIVVIPILVIVTFALFQFAGTIAVEQAVSYAATAGARESAKYGTDAEIQTTVENALAPYNIVTGANCSVIVERFGSADTQIGTFTMTHPTNPAAPSSGETRVTVGVSLAVAPLSSLLGSLGLDLSTRTFKASSLTRFE